MIRVHDKQRVRRWWGRGVTWFRLRSTSNDLVAQGIPQDLVSILLASEIPRCSYLPTHSWIAHCHMISLWLLCCSRKMQLNVVLFSNRGDILFQMCLLPHPLAWLLEVLFYKEEKCLSNPWADSSDNTAVRVCPLHNICETDSMAQWKFLWICNQKMGIVSLVYQRTDLNVSGNSFYKKKNSDSNVWLKSQSFLWILMSPCWWKHR